jgi:hypothetical protein
MAPNNGFTTSAQADEATKDEDLKNLFRRVQKRRNTPKAIVAVAHKLLVRSFIMLRDQIDADEFHRRGVEVRSSRVASGPPSA